MIHQSCCINHPRLPIASFSLQTSNLQVCNCLYTEKALCLHLKFTALLVLVVAVSSIEVCSSRLVYIAFVFRLGLDRVACLLKVVRDRGLHLLTGMTRAAKVFPLTTLRSYIMFWGATLLQRG